MKPDLRIVAALAFLLVIVGALVAASFLYAGSVPAGEGSGGNWTLDLTLGRDDFIYGPQPWVPYNSRLPAVPGSDPAGDNRFMIAFVDLRTSLGKNLSDNRPIEVEYTFKWLRGTAAFHVYGYKDYGTTGVVSWTNRVEGMGSSGLYVAGARGEGPAPVVAQTANNYGHVEVANADGPLYDDFGNGTYRISFGKPGSGLNALEIRPGPDAGGMQTFTADQAGRFYIASGSDSGFDTVLLLVAVNGTMPGDFQLRVRAGHI